MATLEYLKEWTSARIDELMPTNAQSDAPYGYIDRELSYAAEFVLSRAQKHIVLPCVKSGSTFPVTLINNNADVRISLADDFLRFVRLKMTGWSRAVESLHDTNGREYERQAFSMSKGTSARPIAFLVPNSGAGTGFAKMAIEAYDKGTDGTIEFLDYIPKLAPEDIPDSLLDAVVWNAASRVLTILRQPDAGKIAFENMLMLLGGQLIGYTWEGVANGNNQK